jgi:hypothetical protein
MEAMMLNLQKIKIDYCVEQVKKAYRRNYSEMDQHMGNILIWSVYLSLENIANSDALYHDIDHTVMVALAGQSIIEGKHLSEGGVTPKDWVHFLVALLLHDIGYVKGICKADREWTAATGENGATVQLPVGSTDAVLAPYHIGRSKLFAEERFGKKMLMGMEGVIDADLIASYIEMTRFPVPADSWYHETGNFHGLARAADFIGQLGDPNRLQKCTGLFYEFAEIGLNERLGYRTPGDLRRNNAKFYWDEINPYVRDGLRYLRVTQDGKQWISTLQANVFGQGQDGF